jgi:hypothetical protein
MPARILQTLGVITLDGLQYFERPQIFAYELIVSSPGQVFTNLRLTMPGVANYLLKGLTRDCTAGSTTGSVDRRFRFRLLNTEGATWFFSGGLGIMDDRNVDALCFGSAQFPFPIVPPVPVNSSGSLLFEVEDMGINPVPFTTGLPAGYTPYNIHFAFHGSYLIPAVGS